MTLFSDIGLQENILSAIQELGFEKPTPIQEKSIPQLLSSNQDLIAFAQTGTGKTAAFGLPAIQLTDTKIRKPQTLILCPTRELCLQIVKDITNYSKNIKDLSTVAVYGGTNIETQIRALSKGAHIVVATPGRAYDLIRRKKLKLGDVVRVVLDEADEMLTMGFKDDLDAILAETPDTKQTMLFSATMSKEVASVTRKYMNDPIEISAAQKNTAAENVQHSYYMVSARDKYEVLKRLADVNPDIYGIVFCRTRRETKEIANKMMTDGYNADALHGDLSQAQRDEVMGRFRTRHLQILVATDVAARGLDVTDLTHIINFNLPDDNEIYIHRSGRTGRAGKSGKSVAIIHSRETRKISDIERRFKVKFTKEVVPTGREICTKQLYVLIDKVEKIHIDDKQIEPFLPEIYKKLEWLSREDLIKHFVSLEFNRFLEYYKNAKDINLSESSRRDRNDRRDRDDRRDRGERRDRGDRKDSSFSRLFINAGSNDKLNPGRLIGVINEALDSGDAEIGKIEIMKKFSFFEIDKKLDDKLMSAIKGVDFEGISLSVEIASEKPRYDGSDRRRSPSSRGSDRRSGDRRSSEGRSGDRKEGDRRDSRRKPKSKRTGGLDKGKRRRS